MIMAAQTRLSRCQASQLDYRTNSFKQIKALSGSLAAVYFPQQPLVIRRCSRGRMISRITDVAASSTKDQQSRFDPMLVGGDAFVLLSMQMSTTALPVQNTGIVSILLLVTWTAVAAAKRDYAVNNEAYDAWSVAEPVISAIKSSALTWVIFAPLMAVVYGTFITQNLLYTGQSIPAAAASAVSHPVSIWALEEQHLDISTPEVEVIVASLICVTSWRAFYSAFRSWSNLR